MDGIVKLGDGWCQSEEYCLKSLLHIIQYIGTESGAKVGANICQKSNKPITKHYTQDFVHQFMCSTNIIFLFNCWIPELANFLAKQTNWVSKVLINLISVPT